LSKTLTLVGRNDRNGGRIVTLKTGGKEIIAVATAESKAGVKGLYPESDHFRSKFLKNLTDKKEEVEKTLNHLMESLREYKNLHSSDDFVEELDNAEREISAHMHYSLIERKNNELEKIEILIRRALQEEEFGWCEECGERIPDERLLIVPEATRCVPCQRELERLDSTRSLAKRCYTFSGKKHGFQWEGEEDSDDPGMFNLNPDMEYLSIVDLEETDLGDNRREKG
jgi:DnaK suppressor protein